MRKCEKYCAVRQVTGDSVAHAVSMLDNCGKNTDRQTDRQTV